MYKYILSGLLSLMATSFAMADESIHMAKPWQLNFQAPKSPVMAELFGLHNLLLVIITIVSLFVLALMVYIALKFNRKANPVPSTTAHNTLIEIIWTVVPIVILVGIAIPSVRAHYMIDVEPEAEMTLKVTGRQWYWSYEYPDHGGFSFDSYMLTDDEAKKQSVPRLLGVDNQVVVPVDTVVRVQLTGADVIHAWAIPALGVKRDAVPGRLNESWFKATEEGIYYGQCSELCGKGHGFMPIALRVVSKERFTGWVAEQQKVAGITPAATVETPAVTPAGSPALPAAQAPASPPAANAADAPHATENATEH